MVRLFKKRRAKKQAAEAARKAELQKLRDKNRAKREADLKARREAAAAKKAKGPGKTGLPDLGGPVTVGGKTYTSQAAADAAKFREQQKKDQARTKRGLSNIKARRSAGIGETYERTEADGTKRKMIKRDQSKPSQQKTQTKPASQKSSSNKSEFDKKFAEERQKQGAGGQFAFKGKQYTTDLEEEKTQMAKHGGALAIMIAPVKTKKMKAVKKAKNGGKLTDPKKSKKFKIMRSQNSKTGEIEYFKLSGGESTDGGKTYAPSVKTKISKSEYESMMGSKKAKKLGKMKAVKKGAHGAKVKKAEMGGKLKEVPSKAKGLSKLPKKVRNKMGYMKKGGKVDDKMMYGGAMKKAMYGAKMKKKAMYGAKMKK